MAIGQHRARLEGRKVLITGGASGIGRATTALFAQEGAKVVVLDRNITVFGERAAGVLACDVSLETEVVAAVAQAAEMMGGLDGVVNAAGIFHANTLEDTPLELWQSIIGVNLTGTYLVCRAALAALRRSSNATIVNIASGVGLLPTGPGSAAYAVSKGGVIALTKTLALEAAPAIRVNAICPGAVETPMTAGTLRDDGGAVRAAIAGRYAMQRPSTPEELANAILFLTGGESSSITGISLAVDGGRTFH